MNRQKSKRTISKLKNTATLKEVYGYQSKKKLKTSSKRSLVIEYFIKEDRHFSVEELYDEVKKINPRVSFSTVYRALKLLSDLGLASECNFGDGIIRFEPVHKEQHHDHLVCQKCGNIIEFKNEKIEKIQRDVAKKYIFLVLSHRMELYGVCSDCRKKRRRK